MDADDQSAGEATAPVKRRSSVADTFSALFRGGGGLADMRRMPSTVVDEGPKRTVHRYTPTVTPSGLPVLLVPPLGGAAASMDLRRGCSLAEHMVKSGRHTYLVDYGDIEFSDRDLGLEFWMGEVVPAAVRAVSADQGGKPVQLVGWCMGGLFSLIATAAFPDLPVRSVAMVASPIDFSKMHIGTPLRVAAKVTGGRVVGGAIRAMGGASAKLVSVAFKATALPTYVKKPVTKVKRRNDAEFLAHVEAVDHFMGNMHAYPGRALAQAYHRLFHANELATGKLTAPSGRVVDIGSIRVPVMNIGGASDILVPVAATRHLAAIVPEGLCRLETAPGGHLGVLTGIAARTTTWAYLDSFLSSNNEPATR